MRATICVSCILREIRRAFAARSHRAFKGDCELRLAVLEHTGRIPSILGLTYLLPASGGAGFERLPDLKLRAYHDARLLEAEQFPQQPSNRQNRNRHGDRPGERELQQRWTRNIMLNKWLEYCAERGHRFTV